MIDDDEKIQIKEYMTYDMALEKIRKEKRTPGSTAGFFYKVLQESPTEVVEHMEKKAAELVAAGHNIGRSFNTADGDPKKKEAFIKELQKIAVRVQSSVREKTKATEDEDSL
jgi:hypothetical protein